MAAAAAAVVTVAGVEEEAARARAQEDCNIAQVDSAPTLELQWQQSHPLAWLNAPGTEEKAFPRLFPYGVGGFRTAREHRLPLTRYFHTRLINNDSKFRREPEYLLWAEASLRHKEVLDAVHLALRRVPTGIVDARTHMHPYRSPNNSHLLCSRRGVHNTGRGRRLQHRSNEAGSNSAVDNGGVGEGGAVPADDGAGGGAAVQIGSPAPLPTAGEVRRNDAWMTRYGGLHYLNRVRGTVPYWNSVRLELTAMIAQLGPPAIFLTLNPPRPREWPEFFVEISAFGPNTTIDMVCSTRAPALVPAWVTASHNCAFCCRLLGHVGLLFWPGDAAHKSAADGDCIALPGRMGAAFRPEVARDAARADRRVQPHWHDPRLLRGH
jgi:hypothetical protein